MKQPTTWPEVAALALMLCFFALIVWVGRDR